MEMLARLRPGKIKLYFIPPIFELISCPVQVCQPPTTTRILIPKELWKACELYPVPEKEEVDFVPSKPSKPTNKLPLPTNKLPLGVGPGGYTMGSTMEEYKEDSNMITFEVTENMLAKVSHDF